MPNSNRQNQGGSGLKTAATFGLGALLGAVAAGAAWYFASEEEEHARAHQHQNQTYRPNHPVREPPRPAPAPEDSSEKDDEKDGTIKMCEICFVPFVELKQCGIGIVTTPCGHLYCKDCIVAALNVKPECPHCRAHVRERNLTRVYI